jgi:hypothetical protein
MTENGEVVGRKAAKQSRGAAAGDGIRIQRLSPNYLGRVYRSQSQDAEAESHLRPHWRKGHLKSQPHGPKLSLRKIIWIQPYCTGNLEEKKT